MTSSVKQKAAAIWLGYIAVGLDQALECKLVSQR